MFLACRTQPHSVSAGRRSHLRGLHAGEAAHLLEVLLLRLPVRNTHRLLRRRQPVQRRQATLPVLEGPRRRLLPRQRRLLVAAAPHGQMRLRSRPGEVPAALLELSGRAGLLGSGRWPPVRAALLWGRPLLAQHGLTSILCACGKSYSYITLRFSGSQVMQRHFGLSPRQPFMSTLPFVQALKLPGYPIFKSRHNLTHKQRQ